MCGVTNDTNTASIIDQPSENSEGYQVWNPSVGLYHKAASNKRHSYGGIIGALQDKQVESTLSPKAYPENFAGIIAAIQDLKTGTYQPGSDSGQLPPGDSIDNSDPENPIYVPGPHVNGQLWFDTRQGRLFVYVDGSWVQTNGADGLPILLPQQPSAEYLVPGQLWFHTIEEVLYIFNGEFIEPTTGQTFTEYDADLDAVWKPIAGGNLSLQTTATLPLAIAVDEVTAPAYLPDIDLDTMNNQKDFNEWVHDALTAVDTGLSGFQSVVVSDQAPADPAIGQLWYDIETLDLSIWYDDGETQQWVPTSASYAVDTAFAELDAKIETESAARKKTFAELALQVQALLDETELIALNQEVEEISHRIDLLPQYDLDQYVTNIEFTNECKELENKIFDVTQIKPDLSECETKVNAEAQYAALTEALDEKADKLEIESVRDLIPDLNGYATLQNVVDSINNITTEYLPKGGGDLTGSFNLIKSDMSKCGISFGDAANGIKALEFQAYSPTTATKATLGTTPNYWEIAWNFESLEDFCWVYDGTDKVFSITKDGPACSTLYLGDIQANTAGGRSINNKIDVKEKLVTYQTVFQNIRQGVNSATDFDSLKANILSALENV